MTATLLDGELLAAKVRAEVTDRVARLRSAGVTVGLGTILVGDDGPSSRYVAMKHADCDDVGIRSAHEHLPADVSQAELEAVVARFNADPGIHAFLVQLPLPAGLDEERVLMAVDPDKDVDGLHPVNLGRLVMGANGPLPCTPAGIVELLARSDVKTEGAEVVVLGRGNIVGKPMVAILCQKAKNANATVTICHSATRDITSHCRRADILIAAMGVAEFVKAGMVKPGAVVIDVGVNRVPDATSKTGTKLVGDVDFAAVQPVAGKITPNPGGVGPMTIAMLMANTVRAAEMSAGLA
jgi:methylenetetrahydrofolate dehydrogenase (NADP+)/methenyltetrahydrofolate cyclohydrolase